MRRRCHVICSVGPCQHSLPVNTSPWSTALQAAAARHAPARDAPDWEPYWQLLDDLEARASKAAPKSALRPAAGRKPAGRKCARAGQCACQSGAEMLPMLEMMSNGSSIYPASWQHCTSSISVIFSGRKYAMGPCHATRPGLQNPHFKKSA